MTLPDNPSRQDGSGRNTPLFHLKDGTILDNYRLIECIGEGSFGEVWKAKKGDSEVALKILKGSMNSEDAKREAKSLEALKELSHPFLLRTNTSWSDGDRLFIEMEIADGGSLKDRLKACQKAGWKGIPVGELVKYFGEIADALDYLHSQRPDRFLHRDIKPANILLVSGCAKLADFGLLRRVTGDRMGTKTQGGTTVFMAPESIRSNDFSIHTDLFSLAVTYAELRQGRLPFSGQTEYQIGHSILNGAPDLDQDFYPDEIKVLLKALDKDPDRRHASCTEFVSELKQSVPVELLDAPIHTTQNANSAGSDDKGTAPDNSLHNGSTFVPGGLSRQVPHLTPAFASGAAPTQPTSTGKLPWLLAIGLVTMVGVVLAIWFVVKEPTKDVPPGPVAREIEIKTTPPDVIPPALVRTIEIKSMPPGATVYINDKIQIKRTNGIFEVPNAACQLRLVMAEHKEVAQSIGPDEDKIAVALEKLAPSRSYALLVGVNQPSKRLPDFLHAEADVVELGRVLLAGGYPSENIQTVTQGQDDIPPTAGRIRAALKSLVNKCTSSDTLTVALVGHLVTMDGQRACYFCPAESDLSDKATLIPLADIYNQLQQSKAQVKLVLLDGWRNDLFVPPLLPEGIVVSRERAKDLEPPRDVIVFASCSAGARANQHPQARHGLFAYALIRGLQGEAAVEPSRQSNLHNLTDYVIRHVTADALREYTLPQVPELLVGNVDKARIRFNLTDVLIQVNAGVQALEEKNYDKALDAFTEAEAKDPSYVDIYTGRAQAHYFKAKTVSSHYEQAIRDCQHALKLDPRSAAAYSFLAQVIASKARLLASPEERVKEFQLALVNHDCEIQLDPQWAPAFNARGVTQAIRGQYALAIKDYTEAIRLDPRLRFPYENRGFAYSTQKDHKNAIKDFDKAIEINPTNPLNYARRGRSYRSLDQLQQAMDDFNQAIKLDPGNANFLYSRGWAHIAKENFDSAIEDFTEALRFQEDKETLYSRGYAYNEKGFKKKQSGLYDKAIEDLTAAIKLSPEYVSALYVRGVAYQNKARQNQNDEKLYDLAIKDLSAVIKLSPNHANAWYSRGLAYQARGQKALGEADIKKARAIDPNVGKTPGTPEVRLDRLRPKNQSLLVWARNEILCS
jgi:tetratricopeptide (TPR) repeat protein/serine/threonine protein kinase